MEIHVTSQILVFGAMMLCGMAGGLLFDFFRAVRKLIRMNTLWVGLCDLCFWTLCTAAVFYAARFTNQGQLRWYEFIGMISGLLLYFLLFGSLMVRGLTVVLRVLAKGFLAAVRLMLIPVRLLARPILFMLKKWEPVRRRTAFGWSVWRQKALLSRRQLKKILKTPKIFLFWY